VCDADGNADNPLSQCLRVVLREAKNG
jgi:hypothetical protein